MGWIDQHLEILRHPLLTLRGGNIRRATQLPLTCCCLHVQQQVVRLLAPLGVPQLTSSTDARPHPGWPPASRSVQDALAALPFSSRSSASSFFSRAICSSAVMPYFSSFCNPPRAVTRITSGATIQQGVPRGLQGPLAGCGARKPGRLPFPALLPHPAAAGGAEK